MQSPEETFFAERIAAITVPLHMARHNRKWDSARSALKAIPGANVNDVDLCKHRTFCCGSGGRCFWKEGEGHDAHQSHALRSDCRGESGNAGRRMPVLHDDDGGRGQIRSLEEKLRTRDLSELIAESTTIPTK
jgi:hypothetical protein